MEQNIKKKDNLINIIIAICAVLLCAAMLGLYFLFFADTFSRRGEPWMSHDINWLLTYFYAIAAGQVLLILALIVIAISETVAAVGHAEQKYTKILIAFLMAGIVISTIVCLAAIGACIGLSHMTAAFVDFLLLPCIFITLSVVLFIRLKNRMRKS